MNRTAFLIAYRARLVAFYAWASDTAKLDKFMAACTLTISTARNEWNHDGDAVTAAWHAIGGKGKPTLKALRSLPENENTAL
jgi:hypothetical protein